MRTRRLFEAPFPLLTQLRLLILVEFLLSQEHQKERSGPSVQAQGTSSCFRRIFIHKVTLNATLMRTRRFFEAPVPLLTQLRLLIRVAFLLAPKDSSNFSCQHVNWNCPSVQSNFVYEKRTAVDLPSFSRRRYFYYGV